MMYGKVSTTLSKQFNDPNREATVHAPNIRKNGSNPVSSFHTSVKDSRPANRRALRVKVVDIDLDRGLEPITKLAGYAAIKGIVWLHSTPIGYLEVPVLGGQVSADALRAAILRDLDIAIVQHLIADTVASASSKRSYTIDDIINAIHPEEPNKSPLVTVAVCTRERTENLTTCIESLLQIEYPNLELLVVDNAPSTNATERLVRESYPSIRYVREPRPGLDWARNRAIAEARGEIIAYTDDDCIAHPGWVRAVVSAMEEPGVQAVTGLVVPYELETESQQLFECYGGFGRGFQRKWYFKGADIGETERSHLGTGQFGTGANMAFRRSVFDEIGAFDPALDVGTPTNGGGDLEMFFRVLKGGYGLAYEPSAVIRHQHRRQYEKLVEQITNNGIGFFSHLVRCALAYPDERMNVARLGLWWLWYWNLRRMLLSLLAPSELPRELIRGEFRGSIAGLRRYHESRRLAAQLSSDVETYGPLPSVWTDLKFRRNRPKRRVTQSIAVRTIELSQGVSPLTDITNYAAVQVIVSRNETPLGQFMLVNGYHSISAARLREAIASHIGLAIIGQDSRWSANNVSAVACAVVDCQPNAKEAIKRTRLSDAVPVSIVVATYDRPDDLRNCLRCLTQQITERRVEIIVVDNHPASGVTAPIVAEFPGVMLVNETRQGLSYARNQGIVTSTGDIVIATDDDVTMPSDWIERILAPFAQPSVMVVTGNVLPMELETDAQRRFEEYGGLGRGYSRKIVGLSWFSHLHRRAVPTWELGATANSAFRSVIFSDPSIGLLDESLGPGTPTGVGEDTYLFYKVLKAGFDIVYEPDAYVWHRHRRDQQALRRQIYNYSKGHVAYHLLTVINHKDLRGLIHIFVRLPGVRVKQLMASMKRTMQGRRSYPLSLTLTEIAGNIVGPFALWKSRRRVAELGRSDPYIPPPQRVVATVESLDGVCEAMQRPIGRV